jgi:protein TonB
MRNTKGKKHILRAVLSMVIGSSAVFTLVITLNELGDSLDKRRITSATDMQVGRPPETKPKQVVRKRVRRKSRPNHTPPPPSLQAFSSALHGVDVGLPALDLDALSAAGGSLLADASRSIAMTSDTVDRKPRPVRRAELDYPADLRRRGIQGFVVLSILVTDHGQVENVKVVESSPPGVFDNVASEAVRGWQFEPARYKGEPVDTWVRQRVTFELS